MGLNWTYIPIAYIHSKPEQASVLRRGKRDNMTNVTHWYYSTNANVLSTIVMLNMYYNTYLVHTTYVVRYTNVHTSIVAENIPLSLVHYANVYSPNVRPLLLNQRPFYTVWKINRLKTLATPRHASNRKLCWKVLHLHSWCSHYAVGDIWIRS